MDKLVIGRANKPDTNGANKLGISGADKSSIKKPGIKGAEILV